MTRREGEGRDRFLTEAMGECWHEYDLAKPVLTCKGGGFICRKCKDLIVSNNDFSTPEDFERLRSWVADRKFLHTGTTMPQAAEADSSCRETRERFADALYGLLLKG